LPKIKNEAVREDVRLPVNIPPRKFWAMYAALDHPDLVLTQRSADWWRVCMLILWEQGMRRGEVLGLRWFAVDFWTKTLQVAEGSKGRRERDLPILDGLLELLARFYVSEGQPADYCRLLPWRKDTDIRRIYEDWHAIQKLAGVSFRMKDCRSSAGSSMISAGVPTIVVRQMLGHSTVATTEKFYATPSQAALRAGSQARPGGQ
jgi:integrase